MGDTVQDRCTLQVCTTHICWSYLILKEMARLTTTDWRGWCQGAGSDTTQEPRTTWTCWSASSFELPAKAQVVPYRSTETSPPACSGNYCQLAPCLGGIWGSMLTLSCLSRLDFDRFTRCAGLLCQPAKEDSQGGH